MNSLYGRVIFFFKFSYAGADIILHGLAASFALVSISTYSIKHPLSLPVFAVAFGVFVIAELFFIAISFVSSAGRNYSFWSSLAKKLAKISRSDFAKMKYTSAALRKQWLIILPTFCLLFAFNFSLWVFIFLDNWPLFDSIISAVLMFILFAIAAVIKLR